MQGHLVFSFIGELRLGPRDDDSLVIHPVVTYDANLDRSDVAIHTRWILFDEPLSCSIGVWRSLAGARPVFEVTRVLKPEPTPGAVASLCTVSVRLRKELLAPEVLYWVRVFSDAELITQYPMKVSAREAIAHVN